MTTTGTELESAMSNLCEARQAEQSKQRDAISIDTVTHDCGNDERNERTDISHSELQPTSHRHLRIDEVEQRTRIREGVKYHPNGSTCSAICTEELKPLNKPPPSHSSHINTNHNNIANLRVNECTRNGLTTDESNSLKSNADRFSKLSIKKSAERRRRIDSRKQGADSFSWISNKPEHGYIRHPDAKLLIHPSFFSNDGFELCAYNERCVHERNCGETRIRMAAMSYLRNKNTTTYRDLELIWGVSRSTIQRKTNDIQSKKLSDLIFLLNP